MKLGIAEDKNILAVADWNELRRQMEDNENDRG